MQSTATATAHILYVIMVSVTGWKMAYDINLRRLKNDESNFILHDLIPPTSRHLRNTVVVFCWYRSRTPGVQG
jgi:hypothetical protein